VFRGTSVTVERSQGAPYVLTSYYSQSIVQ